MPIEIDEEIARITSKWAFTLDEITTEIDTDGALRFLMPERVAKRIMDMSGVKSISHTLGNYFYDLPQDEKTARVVSLFTGRTKLISNVQRKTRGVTVQGVSESDDVMTGGADYVFVRPSVETLDYQDWAGTLRYEPTQILRRLDWFAYHGDSYGVKNPDRFAGYLHSKNKPEFMDYIDEITNPTHRSEMMLRDSLDSSGIYSIALDGQTAEEAISALKGLGITEWNGRKIEDVIIRGKGHS
jgi:hypothetical protein